ncbi:olfactory receptor 7G2-like [Cricetulus griseus]|uniref:Olfactory receptor 7G2-like n=1 Tax=Cricetulus griseus TaxID=10029 RepID=A0A9J7FT04_CRIGR|nr:olfactory receptor 7G2-like [Cricetulus griseus]XP_027267424.1 olfactory receptor 7G2-like [Cricetulus griseus]
MFYCLFSVLIGKMELKNQTAILEFHLIGLTNNHELDPIIYSIFLSIYLVTILGNLIILLAICSDSQLHSPMYFFLSILSINDICLSTSTIPKMLVNIQTQKDTINYIQCISQLFFVSVFSGMENFLLAVMAYDGYVAICKPLRYKVTMNPCCCVLFVLLCLFLSIIDALLHSLMVLHLSFCIDLEIPNFFCELAQILKLSCSDTFINNLLILIAVFIFAGGAFCGVIFSYIYILFSVLRLTSQRGKNKAFSTCTSHLFVVSLFYGTGLGVYLNSSVTDSPRKLAVASVMYTVVPQMLNPFIYSLRNRDIKKSFGKFTGWIFYVLPCVHCHP